MPASKVLTRTFTPMGLGEMRHVLHSLYPGGYVRSVGDLSGALETQVKGVRELDSSRERQALAAGKTAGKEFVTEGERYP